MRQGEKRKAFLSQREDRQRSQGDRGEPSTRGQFTKFKVIGSNSGNRYLFRKVRQYGLQKAVCVPRSRASIWSDNERYVQPKPSSKPTANFKSARWIG